jgi:hypothetical protein
VVTLTANGKTYTQPITVKQDPRVKTPALAMRQVYTLSRAMYDEAKAAAEALQQRNDEALAAAAARLTGVMNVLQGADVPATAVQLTSIAEARAAVSTAMARWRAAR